MADVEKAAGKGATGLNAASGSQWVATTTNSKAAAKAGFDPAKAAAGTAPLCPVGPDGQGAPQAAAQPPAGDAGP